MDGKDNYERTMVEEWRTKRENDKEEIRD